MQKDILDEKTSFTIVRTKDLVYAETLILSAFFISIIWTLFNPYVLLIETIVLLFCPGLYTMLWRYQSIRHDKSKQQQDIQSGVTIVLFVWSLLESMLVLPYSFGLSLEAISKDLFFIKRVFFITPFLITTICLFYLLKSFTRSMKIDARKSRFRSGRL
jgi:NADH:ubiquinone oxidoreductase subunit 6 (subunit J)